MRAIVVASPGERPALREISRPALGSHDVLLRVRAAGVCHTDLKVRDGQVDGVEFPVVLGHEIAGEVEAVGSMVASVSEGDRGVPYGYITCSRCEHCLAGDTSLCERVSLRYGFGNVGGYSEYVAIPESFFLRISGHVSFEDAAVATCSVVTPYRALVKRAKLRPGETVVLVGAGGGVGLHATQLARWMGARVVAVDADEGRREEILGQGADHVVLPTHDGFADAVREALNGEKADVVIDMVVTPSTIADSASILKRGGRLVLVGYRPDIDFSLPTPELVFSEFEIMGSHWASVSDLREVLDLVSRGVIKPVVRQHLPLEEAAVALDLLELGAVPGRTVLLV